MTQGTAGVSGVARCVAIVPRGARPGSGAARPLPGSILPCALRCVVVALAGTARVIRRALALALAWESCAGRPLTPARLRRSQGGRAPALRWLLAADLLSV